MSKALSLNELIVEKESSLKKLNSANGDLLNWEQECLFAKQQITKNSMSTDVASKNPQSLQNALMNVGAIGLSLNPATAHAYLVPRGGAICLDVSFRGLVALATQCGSISWAKSELVYSGDNFTWNGPNVPPIHEADVFGDRGKPIGGYCLAKMPDGDYMVETMTEDELMKIKATSKAANGPWKTWEEEMKKKSLTKRAYKSWPQAMGEPTRLDKAIEVLHEAEGVAFTIDEQIKFFDLLRKGDALELYVYSQKMHAEDKWVALYNSFEKDKTKEKKNCDELTREGFTIMEETVIHLRECIEASDGVACKEIVDELIDAEFFINRLEPQHQKDLDEMLNELEE